MGTDSDKAFLYIKLMIENQVSKQILLYKQKKGASLHLLG